MTVRDIAGRRRFVLFDLPEGSDAGMGLVITLFGDRCRELGIDRREIRFRVVHVGDGIGIVRCSHTAKDQVLEMINSTTVGEGNLRTFKTSGTLRTLKDWLRTNRNIRIPGKTPRPKRKASPPPVR